MDNDRLYYVTDMDFSSVDELARSIDMLMYECPHMSVCKQADFLAERIWEKLQYDRDQKGT